MNQARGRPSISVIVPALNEAATIRRAISPLLADPAATNLEVIVAAGPSTDGTREVLMEMADLDPRIRLIDNPARITPEGLNAAIRSSRGSVILRMDGHAEPDPGYVSACIQTLETSGAWNVGGRMRKIGLTAAARAAAAATSSAFGIGGGRRFHVLTTPEDVDTVWLGCWPRWVFERVGLFDPEMIQDQDDEFNQRIVDAGGVIRFNPAISAAYISRASWHGLVRQYFRYGMYKVRGFQKRPGLLRPRHLIPAVVVASAVGTLLLGMLTPWGLLAFGLGAAAWLAAAVFFGRRVAPTYDATLLGIVVAYACLHVSYGLGTWVGLVRFGRRWFTDRAGSVPRLDPLDSLTTPTSR